MQQLCPVDALVCHSRTDNSVLKVKDFTYSKRQTFERHDIDQDFYRIVIHF